MKRIHWFEILLIVVVMSISLYAALSDAQNLSMRWFTRDDAYYYFKVAQNISEGHGSTFDGINPTNGYHPLWLWICVPIFALARFDLILPLRILLLVLGGFSAGTAILLFRLLGKVFTPAIGAIAAIYWVFSLDVLDRVYKQGLETGVAAFFIMLFVYKLFEFEITWRKEPVSTKQLAILGLIAVLVMFSRLDLVFLVGLAGITVVFRKHPLRYLLPLDIAFIFISVLLSMILRVTFDKYYKFSDAAVVMIALSLIIKIPAAYLSGLYQHTTITNVRSLLKQLILFGVSSSAIVGALMIVITPIGHFEGFPRAVIFYDLAITLLFFGGIRLGILGVRTNTTKVTAEESPLKQIASNWKTWLTESSIYYGVVLGALAVYMLWNKLAFGTSSPVSGQIKRWWGSLSGQVYGGHVREVLGFFGIDYSSSANAWHPVSTILGAWIERFYKIGISDVYRYLIVLSVFALVFYIRLLMDKQKGKSTLIQLSIIPLLAGAWLQVLSYHMTGYSAYKEWYWTSQLLINVLVLSMIAGMVFQTFRKYPASVITLWIAAGVIGLSMGSSYWTYVARVMPYNETSANTPYNDIATFLEEHTEPGSIIGMTGGGNAGYFIHDRTVVNMDGLINSYAYFHLLQKREAGKYFMDMGMDYILANIEILGDLPYKRQFEPYYQWTNQRYGGKELIRYNPNLPGD
ncbi:MAG: hypothetical protein IPP66_21595 [Anaerolineales bacterium]|nr:hypothetical protein [Anaerolineales bacterium]